ncbi:MAG: LysR family transcriptional regulator, partial [Oscillospiraceae bacterium]
VKEIEAEAGIQIINRSVKGITLTSDGTEFLSYARQIVEQTELMEQRYFNKKPSKQLCSVSTQHYAFAVNAFVNLISALSIDEYEFTLRETRTYEIIEDVKNFHSEIGILYLSEFNEKIITKLLKENHLVFSHLFTANPHVFISSTHPLAEKKIIALENLESYPCLAFEQGEYNSFYFSEEILSTLPHRKIIHVSDRATLFNLLIGLNGYTICTGVLNTDLNGDNIVSVPLETSEKMHVGWIKNERANLSTFAQSYITELKRLIFEYKKPL